MRNFILFSFFIIVISLLTISKAHSLNSFFEFSSEESSKKINTAKKSSSKTHSNSYSNNKEEKPKSIEPTKQKTAKENKKIKKQKRKEFRKAIWKSIKEQRKINKEIKKENKKNGIKNSNKKIHWAAYLSFFSTLTSLGIIATAIILNPATYAIFSFLIPFAIGLLVLSLLASIFSISAVASNETTLYHKSHTITLALIGGIIAFLSLLFIGFVVLAISALSY